MGWLWNILISKIEYKKNSGKIHHYNAMILVIPFANHNIFTQQQEEKNPHHDEKSRKLLHIH